MDASTIIRRGISAFLCGALGGIAGRLVMLHISLEAGTPLHSIIFYGSIACSSLIGAIIGLYPQETFIEFRNLLQRLLRWHTYRQALIGRYAFLFWLVLVLAALSRFMGIRTIGRSPLEWLGIGAPLSIEGIIFWISAIALLAIIGVVIFMLVDSMSRWLKEGEHALWLAEYLPRVSFPLVVAGIVSAMSGNVGAGLMTFLFYYYLVPSLHPRINRHAFAFMFDENTTESVKLWEERVRQRYAKYGFWGVAGLSLLLCAWRPVALALLLLLSALYWVVIAAIMLSLAFLPLVLLCLACRLVFRMASMQDRQFILLSTATSLLLSVFLKSWLASSWWSVLGMGTGCFSIMMAAYLAVPHLDAWDLFHRGRTRRIGDVLAAQVNRALAGFMPWAHPLFVSMG